MATGLVAGPCFTHLGMKVAHEFSVVMIII